MERVASTTTDEWIDSVITDREQDGQLWTKALLNFPNTQCNAVSCCLRQTLLVPPTFAAEPVSDDNVFSVLCLQQ